MAGGLFLVFAMATSASMNCPLHASFHACMSVYIGHTPKHGITTSEGVCI